MCGAVNGQVQLFEPAEGFMARSKFIAELKLHCFAVYYQQDPRLHTVAD